ncbi:uncharacterized protein LOC143291211 [Babylonia areolata]|uniref:uncharacterized protein LOC143291211 n=1 Tax=Babylonia areolata TaxID=304850 RepID=UPI003FD30D87
MSSKRDRRSRSGSSDPPSSKQKRVLDLVSTRRYSPPGHYHQRYFRGGSGRGRPSRRPFMYRGSRGMSSYRGASERYYPRYQRYNNRDETHNRRRRSRSYSHSRSHSRGRSAEKSRSRDRQKPSDSDSSSSDSGSQRRRQHSKTPDQRRSPAREKEQTHVRSSHSPDDKTPVRKKTRRHSSPFHEKDRSHRSRSDSREKHRSHDRSQYHYGNRHEEERPKYYVDKHASKPDEHYTDKLHTSKPEEDEKRKLEKYVRRSRSLSPEIQRTSRKSAVASKGKELIPRNRLHKIFSLISQDSDFELDEDISIAIQRNPYAEPSEDSTVTVVFDEGLFNMIYPYEGRKHKPIFDREEIKAFGHDKNLADDPDFERRVIRVKPGKSSQQTESGQSSSASYQYKSSLNIVRTVKRSQSSSRSRSRSASPSTQRNPQFRLRMSTHPRFEARYAELQRGEEMGSSRRPNLDPNDLRHELSSGRKSSSDSRSRVDREKDRHDSSRRMSSEQRDEKTERKKEGGELPDYSRRKDKYQYTPWLDQPELIPKDPKYFMHDDRESMDMRDRGRGRFMRGRTNYRRPFRPYRSRGPYRGPYRGRGNYNNHNDSRYMNDPRSRSPRRSYTARRNDDNRSVEREWKHDKFSELETDGEKSSQREDDQHPHSTSER